MIWNLHIKVTKKEEIKIEKAEKTLKQIKELELKKGCMKIILHKELWKYLFKEFKAYLQAWSALINLLK